MKKILVEIFECDCCRFVEYVVKNAIRGYEEKVECKNYTLPQDRAVFEKYGVMITEANGILKTAPLVVLIKEGEKEVKIDKVNRIRIQRALDSFLKEEVN